MNLVSDYFLLYHGVTFEQNPDFVDINTKINDDTFSIFALFLSITRKEKQRFFQLESFENLCKLLNVSLPTNDNELYKLQFSIINLINLHKSKSLIYTLNQSFVYLHEEEILNLENYNIE